METKHQRHKRLAKAAAERMRRNPNERTRQTLFRHMKGLCSDGR